MGTETTTRFLLSRRPDGVLPFGDCRACGFRLDIQAVSCRARTISFKLAALIDLYVLPLYSRTVLVLYHPPTSYIALVPAGAVTEGPACSISDHSPEVTRSLCMADIFSKKEVWQTCLNSFFLCICIIYAWLVILIGEL